jgi:signal peptidase
MELTPLPSRRSLLGRLWLLVAVALLAPLVGLVVLPAALGLQRFVVTSDGLGDSVPRGSLTFAERAPAVDLGVGDVITFRPPGAAADAAFITHRVVSVTPDEIRTGDQTGPDPWTLPTTGDRWRVVAQIPYVGYPFISDVRPTMWVLLVSVPMLTVLMALVTDLERARQRRRVLKRGEREQVSDRDAQALH